MQKNERVGILSQDHPYKLVWILLILSFYFVGFGGYMLFGLKDLLRILTILFLLLFYLFAKDRKIVMYIYPFTIFLPAYILEIGAYPKHTTIPVLTTKIIPLLYPYLVDSIYIKASILTEIFFAFYLFHDFIKGKFKAPYPILLLTIILSSFISIFFAYDKTIAWFTFFFLSLHVLTFVLYSTIEDFQTLQKIFNIYFIALVFVLLPIAFSGGLRSVLTGKFYMREGAFLIKAPNTGGILISITLPLTLGKFILEKRKTFKLAYMFIFFTLSLALIKTGSRNGLIASFAAIFTFVFLSFKKMNKKHRTYLYLSSALVLLSLYLFTTRIPILKMRLNMNFILMDPSIQLRLITWKKIIEHFIRHPFSIVGIGNFQYSQFQFGLAHAHNFFLHNLIEIGIFGALAILLLYLFILKELWLTLKRTEGNLFIYITVISLISSLIASFVNFSVDMKAYTTSGIEIYCLLLSISLAYARLKIPSRRS